LIDPYHLLFFRHSLIIKYNYCLYIITIDRKWVPFNWTVSRKKTGEIYVQGSYRNRVNVKQDSDVDIGIIYTGNTFYPDYPEGMTATDFGNIDGDYNYKDFKNEVEKALVAYFGKSAMPTRILDVHLHRQVLKNDQYRPKKSDLEDWGGIGVASCYCDVVVCEKHFANMLSRNNYKPTARVVTRLDDVIECTV